MMVVYSRFFILFYSIQNSWFSQKKDDLFKKIDLYLTNVENVFIYGDLQAKVS